MAKKKTSHAGVRPAKTAAHAPASGKKAMRSQAAIERHLRQLELAMRRQTERVLSSGDGWGGVESLFWDGRCVERRVLRWLLRLPEVPFNAADTMAGW